MRSMRFAALAALSLIATSAIALPANAGQPLDITPNGAAVAVGAGVVAGVGLNQGWWSIKGFATHAPRHAATSAKWAAAGASVAAGIIITAAITGTFDLVGRLTCNDINGLGGPGFSEPIKPTDNVMPPQNCGRR